MITLLYDHFFYLKQKMVKGRPVRHPYLIVIIITP